MNDFTPRDQAGENQPAPVDPSPVAADASDGASSKWLSKIGFFVLAIGVFFGLKFYNKNSTSDNVKQQMYEICAEFPDQARIRKIIDKHHDHCFEESFRMGGRRSSSKFDDERYVKMMTSAIQREIAGDVGLQQMLAAVQQAEENEVAEETDVDEETDAAREEPSAEANSSPEEPVVEAAELDEPRP